MSLETGRNALLNVTEEWKPDLGNVITPLLSMVVKIVKERNLNLENVTQTFAQVIIKFFYSLNVVLFEI